jgi:hypothetical protein
MLQTPEQIHHALDVMLQSQLYARLKYSDWQIGCNRAHANYRLGAAVDENLQIVHTEDCLCLAFSLSKHLNLSLMADIEESQNRVRFRLKLLGVNIMSCDESDYPAVHCVLYRDVRSRAGLQHMHVTIPAADASVALAAAVIETVLLDYLV